MKAENPNFNNKQEKGGALAVTILRPELYEILEKYGDKQRFDNMGFSPEVIEGETVSVHTKRLLIDITKLSISEKRKERCSLMAGVHDLPEIEVLEKEGKTADITAFEKANNPNLDKKTEEIEREMAVIIFNEIELKLYDEFSNAGPFLKKGEKPEIQTEDGVIVKILDRNDADLKFHKLVKKDRKNWSFLGEKEKCLSFRQYRSFSQNLDLLRNTNFNLDIINLCQDLLDETMFSVIDIWKDVPANEMPQGIREGIEKFEIHDRNPQRTDLDKLN